MILGIYGSGGLGREVLDLAKEINACSRQWEKIVFINDFKNESIISQTEVFTFDEFRANFAPGSAKAVVAVGEPKVRQVLREKLISGAYALQTLIHPTAHVGTDTKIGDGVVLQYGSFVSCNVKLGDNVFIQPIADIGHDAVIGTDSLVSSFVQISGNCSIGERVYIGISVPVKEGVSVGSDTIIGMGSVVVRDIPEKVIALGNPARPMKKNDDGRVFI